jgi:hypothetical protein
MATKTAKKNVTTTTWTATEIATFLSEASTPSEKGTATRRLKAYVAQRASQGANAERVERNVRALSKRFE